MKRIVLMLPMFLAGCAYHPQPVSVFGRSGAAYTAPSLCEALVKCLNSTEPSCFYDRSLMQTAAGSTELEECKEVRK